MALTHGITGFLTHHVKHGSNVYSSLSLATSLFLFQFLVWRPYSVIFFLSSGLERRPSHELSLSLWPSRNLTSLPESECTFLQDCNVYLKVTFDHKSDFFMSLIRYPCDGKSASVSKTHYHLHYFKRFGNKKHSNYWSPLINMKKLHMFLSKIHHNSAENVGLYFCKSKVHER